MYGFPMTGLANEATIRPEGLGDTHVNHLGEKHGACERSVNRRLQYGSQGTALLGEMVRSKT